MATPCGQLPDKRRSLRDVLLADLHAGRHPPGAKLPSEWEFASRYGVSRATVRGALDLLAAEGLLQRRKGQGTWFHPAALERLAAARPPTARIALVLKPSRIANAIFEGILAAFSAALPDHLQTEVHYHETAKPASYATAAVVVLDGGFSNDEIAAVRQHAAHLIVLNRMIPGVPSVCTDNVMGGALMVQHAVECGHRRLGVLHFGEDHRPGVSVEEFTLRLQGIRAACKRAGIVPVEIPLELHRMFAFPPAAAVERLLREAGDVTLILTVADHLAFAVLESLQERGIAVPQRIGIIGFDDIRGTRFSTPAMTTVRQPVDELGRVLAEGIAALLAGRPAGLGAPIRLILVPRETCPRLAG